MIKYDKNEMWSDTSANSPTYGSMKKHPVYISKAIWEL